MSVLSALILLAHDLATVLLIGNFILLLLVYLPLIRDVFPQVEANIFLNRVLIKAHPWNSLSLLIFMASGVALMLVNENYLGVGQFVNTWSILMLVKHVVVIGMAALVFWIRALTRPALAARASSKNALVKLIYSPRAQIAAQAVMGVVVLLLTALARL